jgi:serine/threonine protein kinase
MADAPKAPGTDPSPKSEEATHIKSPAYPSRNGSHRAPRNDTGGSRIEPGLLLGHTWIVEEFLGRGGMGEVWRCAHVELGSEHAIKIILPELANEPNFVALFKEEARRLSRLQSDAIVRYEGLFRDEWGRQYLVMEFVDGPSLSSVLKERRPSLREIQQLLDRVALGLEAAHDQSIFHRDISPDNIILPEGRVERAKIIDFGIAKSLDPGDVTLIGSQFAGKHAFVSPEQAGLFGGRVDARSDIYCLGLVLAAASLGFGKQLNMGSSPASIIQARMSVPDLHEIPSGLRSLLNWMLQPDPSRRPQSIHALLARDHTELVVDKKREPRLYAEPKGQPSTDQVSGASSGTEPATRQTQARRAQRPPSRETSARLRRISSPFANLRGASSAIISMRQAVGGSLAALAIAVVIYAYLRVPVVDLNEITAEARSAAQGTCALLDIAAVRDGSRVEVRVAGVVAGAGERDRLNAMLQQIRAVNGVVDEALVAPSGMCPTLRTLAAILPTRETRDLRIIGGAASDSGPLHDGGTLSLQVVQSGERNSFVYVDSFSADGMVTHLLPSPARMNNVLPQGQQIAIDGKAALSHARGGAVVSVIAASKLLLAASQPEESGDRYAVALRNAIEEPSADGGHVRVTSVWLTLRTPSN